MANNKSYSEKLRDPRWQKKRLEIMQRDHFACQSCFSDDKTLHVHHRYYETGKEPWDYSDKVLVTLCENCHSSEEAEKQEAIQSFYRCLCNKGFLNWQIKSLASLIESYIPTDIKFPNEISAFIETLLFNNEFREKVISEFQTFKKRQIGCIDLMPW